MKPLAIDLYCGLGGWSEGLLAEGWEVVGFDVERHVYGEHRYPGQLVLQDVLTIQGAQFRHASLIVASPPCQTYSYMAMPFTRGRRIAQEYRDGTRSVESLNALFDACFRIQREASEAAGRHIPMVVENVKGAQPWVGRAKTHYGSFYLWGDVPARMPSIAGIQNGVKVASVSGRRTDIGNGARFTSRDCGIESKQPRFNDDKRKAAKCGGDWFGSGADCSLMRQMSSKSNARKAASAQIAKIPLDLARYIARVFAEPESTENTLDTGAQPRPTGSTPLTG